ncbi:MULTISPECIES: hypothetical protein [unclassified Methylobacterium]|jgi:hypothetical protein|uniref:hypothetical protein n=1 Tax=unclassified Methylobacterium TaxID=2615210 RepID=UPI0005B799F9|nr:MULTISPECIES: hypothetical protein [unclassified Methylobacterium]SFU94295.1 hypothetical protein SAMN02799643_03321 [Methylobacterium sp. UNCCL125]
MEQVATSCVGSAPRRKETESHKRRSAHSLPIKVSLAAHIQAAVQGMPTGKIARLVDGPDDDGKNVRREIGVIRSGRPERIAGIGFERYLVFCESLKVDPALAMTGAPPVRRRVH